MADEEEYENLFLLSQQEEDPKLLISNLISLHSSTLLFLMRESQKAGEQWIRKSNIIRELEKVQNKTQDLSSRILVEQFDQEEMEKTVGNDIVRRDFWFDAELFQQLSLYSSVMGEVVESQIEKLKNEDQPREKRAREEERRLEEVKKVKVQETFSKEYNSITRLDIERDRKERDREKETDWGKFKKEESEDEEDKSVFISAKQKLHQDQAQKGAKTPSVATKSLGIRKRFVSPVPTAPSKRENDGEPGKDRKGKEKDSDKKTDGKKATLLDGKLDPEDDRLKNIDPTIIETIGNEILDRSPAVFWRDIVGLEFAKKSINEIIVWPMLKPELFTGIRTPPKGLLLFGPPGTGKTMIGKAIASEAKATFFSISASSLTSKWVGSLYFKFLDHVFTLFRLARERKPSGRCLLSLDVSNLPLYSLMRLIVF
eukprot:TRINITY_DN9330_c0_g1_i1.p1 TRINITY_DN9330_c0_g1~~TRINITY_DN9330_c0_g1_i1.p1  ORF type:complete len:428 (-),score=74.77 TRINITY_DN9330_c0_g1_i1:583-1866(-)